jgi:type VII secretion protein EccB
LTTKAQVNGYRFLLRRFEHALVRREVRMLHDPMVTQFRSLIVGLVLAVLITGGCLALAFFKPQGQVGQSTIIMDSGSGALYALVDNALHPALNLASARLITGKSDSPAAVKDSKLAGYPRGPILGIPGAPAALPGSAQPARSDWTLCDTIDDPSTAAGVQTTVLAGPVHLGQGARRMASGEALLASYSGDTYLIYDGRHARIDMTSNAIQTALHLSGQRPRTISAGLLDATMPVPDLTAPVITNAGARGSVRHGDLRVGSIIQIADSTGSTLYVVLDNGIQKVSPFVADTIRAANSVGVSDVVTVPLDAISGVPVVDSLPVDRFPATRPTLLSADDDPVSCVNWVREGDDAAAALSLLAGSQLPLADSAKPVTMADTSASHAATAYVPPSSGEFVQVTGIEPGSARRDGLYYIADTGVRYGVPDKDTAAVLGLGNPKLAPWQIVDRFAAGPTLSRDAALVEHDTLTIETAPQLPGAAAPQRPDFRKHQPAAGVSRGQ